MKTSYDDLPTHTVSNQWYTAQEKAVEAIRIYSRDATARNRHIVENCLDELFAFNQAEQNRQEAGKK